MLVLDVEDQRSVVGKRLLDGEIGWVNLEAVLACTTWTTKVLPVQEGRSHEPLSCAKRILLHIIAVMRARIAKTACLCC